MISSSPVGHLGSCATLHFLPCNLVILLLIFQMQGALPLMVITRSIVCLSETFTMYYQGKAVEEKPSIRVTKPQRPQRPQRPQVQRRPSVYNQRAKEGFKFWLQQDPMVNRISCKGDTWDFAAIYVTSGN